MFKSSLKSILLLAAAFALAACGGQASAQAIPGVYKSQSGLVVGSVANAISIQCAVGAVYTLQGNFRSTNFDDGTGALCTKLTALVSDSGTWLRIGATTQWVNTAYIARAECVGNQSKVRWGTYYDQNYVESFADNCALVNALVTRAN
jgi:spermidine/putrescine-binding protein